MTTNDYKRLQLKSNENICLVSKSRGHSWSLVAIRGHSWSLVVTGGHSWSLVAICGHPWSFVVTGVYLEKRLLKQSLRP